LTENPDYNLQELSPLVDTMHSYAPVYSELFATLTDYKKLRELRGGASLPSGDLLSNSAEMAVPFIGYSKMLSGNVDYLDAIISRTYTMHIEAVSDIQNLLIANRTLFNMAYKNVPKLRKHPITIGPYMKILYDEEKGEVYLSTPTEDEFYATCYATAEKIDSWGERLEENGNEDGWMFAIDILKSAAPFAGSVRDLISAGKTNYRGEKMPWETENGWKDFAYGLIGLELDVASMGGSGFLKGGAELVEGGGKAAKVARAAKITHYLENVGEKAMFAGMAVDMTPAALAAIGVIDSVEFSSKYYATDPSKRDEVIGETPTGFGLHKAPDHFGTLEEAENFYFEAIRQMVEFTKWTNLKYKVIDIDHIQISRWTSDKSVIVSHEAGGTWNLDGDLAADGGYENFQQAVAMANLAIKTEDWLDKEDLSAAGYAPFYVSSSGDIEFDKDWNPFAVDIFESGSDWLHFYEKILHIPKDWIVNLLNRAYKKNSKSHSILSIAKKNLDSFNA